MKIMRNIISFLVGSTFALCLASCSGGMHDASTDPYRAGNVNASGEGSVFLVGGLAATYVDGSQYKNKSTTLLSGQTVFEVTLSKEGNIDFSFSYQGSDTWGGGTGEINFAILSDVDNGWSPNMRWGGVSGSPVKADGSADIEAGSTNITLSGMTSGHQYKLSGVLYAAGGVLSLEDKGEFTIPVPDYTLLDGYFIRGVVAYYNDEGKVQRKWDVGDCGNFVLVNGAKSDEGDVVYEVKWTPTIGDLNTEFLISDSKAKTLYKAFAKKKEEGGKKVDVEVPKLDIDGAELELSIADDEDNYSYGNIESKQNVLKGVEYTFRVRTTASNKDADGNETGKKVFVSVISGNDWDFFNETDAMGDFNNADGVPLSNGSFTIDYKNDMKAWGGGNGTCNFKIRRIAGSWDYGDFGYGSIVNSPAPILPTGVEFKESWGNIQLTGLQNGTKYKFEFEPQSDDPEKLIMTVSVVE